MLLRRTKFDFGFACDLKAVIPAKAGIQPSGSEFPELGLGPSLRWGDEYLDMVQHPVNSLHPRCTSSSPQAANIASPLIPAMIASTTSPPNQFATRLKTPPASNSNPITVFDSAV